MVGIYFVYKISVSLKQSFALEYKLQLQVETLNFDR